MQEEQVLCEYKQRVMECHPDKHPDDPEAEDRFKLLQEAKNILCDPQNRRCYDKWLKSGIQIPFNRWLSLSKTGQTNCHWVNTRDMQPMIDGQKDETNQSERSEWESDPPDEILKKFRNYEI